MAAPNLYTLLQFELHFENAAVTFLESEVGIDCYPAASNENFVTPRLDIQFQTNDANEPVDAPITSTPSLPKGEYRKYAAAFEVRVVTDASTGQTRAQHFEYVGKTRAALLRSADNWGSANLPYYGLKDIRPTGTEREVDGDLQITTLRHAIQFSIRSDSFPS